MGEVGSRGEGVRRRNLATVLRLAHLDGPLPRSALTEATGLNRSTTADLVGELVRLGLVEEKAPDPSRRVGRPSPVVAPTAGVVAIAANPEVDALTLAAVGLDRSIPVRERIEVDHLLTPEETAALLADRIERWRGAALADARIVGVGLAVPGLVRAADGIVRDAPHLHWTDAPLRDLVASATTLPVVVGNDASLGALAEHLFGAAHGVADVVYLNGGASGIGGGLVIGGMPVAGAGGYAGEFGQNRPGIAADADRRTDHGVLEDEVSRARLLAVVGLAGADEPTLAAALREAAGREAAGREAAGREAAGREAERRAEGAGATASVVSDELERQRRILAVALANAVNVLNPRMIVLGGFLATLAELDGAGLDADVRASSMPANGESLEIRSAALAEDRLLIGAAEAAFAELLADPLGQSAD